MIILDLWETLEQIFKDQREKIQDIEVRETEKIPSEIDLNLEIGRWYRIRNVVSLYVDMKGSTQLSNDRYIKTSAKMYEIFTGSLIKILKKEEFKAHFIDIKGDGGFALWKEKYGSVKALLAAVTFKTYVEKYLKNFIGELIDGWEIASKIGIAKGEVLVKRVGERNRGDKKYNWAVWAGKPVNYSAKLSDLAEADTVLVTEKVFEDFSYPKELEEYLIFSCECSGKTILWTGREDLNNKNFFEENVWELKSCWCERHGKKYLNKVLEIINR